jgi:hypothetical protein
LSPVFTLRSSLVSWIVEHEDGVAPEAADAFVDQGWAPSGIATPTTGFLTGLQAAAGPAVAVEWMYVQAGDHTTLSEKTRVQHVDHDVIGTIVHRAVPPNGEYYLIEWERGLPSILVEETELDPTQPMTTFTRRDGFTVLDE